MFLDDNFLIKTHTARTLFHECAKHLPIFDYHSHINPQEIAENKVFENISQAWFGGDHYKWRLMRADGCDERLVTGEASDKEKFEAYAELMPKAFGNPLYHFSHLELKNIYGINSPLSPTTADTIWDSCQVCVTARELITSANVRTLCTTDDPVDNLEWHEIIAKESSFDTRVFPSFRPDKVLNIDKHGFTEYIQRLCGEVKTLDDVKAALQKRMDYFSAHGCVTADHGLESMVYIVATSDRIANIFAKAMRRENISKEEAEMFKTDLLLFCAREYAKRGWVMQLHYNVQRNVNSLLMNSYGADAGGDCIRTTNGSEKLTAVLDALSKTNELPKTVLYSLNPSDNAMLTSVAYSFRNVQHGSAWWFNDTKEGIETQLKNLAGMGLLGNFIGMLTDSRSFLSYARHEYFRRILCNMLGQWAEDGEIPNDYDTLYQIIRGVCYENAVQFFGLNSRGKN